MHAQRIENNGKHERVEVPGSERSLKDSLVRRLALAKLRELRRAGLSYREIGQRFGAPRGGGSMSASGFEYRLSPERLLTSGGEASDATVGGQNSDVRIFLRALDALEQGLAFFDRTGMLLHANRMLTRLLESGESGEQLQAEVQHFARTLSSLIRLRALGTEETVEELATREVPTLEGHLRLKGNYVGLDLFGRGGTLLITLEPPPSDPLSEAALRERFGLTKKESRILRLLAEGKSNSEIASRLFLSPHTVRHHTEHVLRKLGVKSRAEAAAKVLRRSQTGGEASG